MKMSGKQLSLFSKIFASIWVAGSLLVSYFIKWRFQNSLLNLDEVTAILEQGIFFALLFSPIDISMWIQNIRGDRVKICDDKKEEDAVGK